MQACGDQDQCAEHPRAGGNPSLRNRCQRAGQRTTTVPQILSANVCRFLSHSGHRKPM
jgi:hypothetical protein